MVLINKTKKNLFLVDFVSPRVKVKEGEMMSIYMNLAKAPQKVMVISIVVGAL